MHSEADLHAQRWYATEHVIDDIEMRERIYAVNFKYLLNCFHSYQGRPCNIRAITEASGSLSTLETLQEQSMQS
jgi:hypothetical protein